MLLLSRVVCTNCVAALFVSSVRERERASARSAWRAHKRAGDSSKRTSRRRWWSNKIRPPACPLRLVCAPGRDQSTRTSPRARARGNTMSAASLHVPQERRRRPFAHTHTHTVSERETTPSSAGRRPRRRPRGGRRTDAERRPPCVSPGGGRSDFTSYNDCIVIG
jgi:hypothetical protein